MDSSPSTLRVRAVLLSALALAACATCPPSAPSALSPSAAAQGGADSQAGAPGKVLSGVSANCLAWSSYQDGPYKYENNQWGRDKAQGKFEQCLLKRESGGRAQYGWTWSWPGFDPTVFAYPEIVFGWKPWTGGNPSDPRFPLRVADVRQLALHYDVETEATGKYNLAPEIWLTKSGKWTAEPQPKSITTEIMFWMDFTADVHPAGSIIDTPTLDGVTYELWKMDNIGKETNGTGWALLSFKRPTTQRRGTLGIDTPLKHLVDKKLVDPDHYLASIEFGNEVVGGMGTTWVKRFEVEVRP
jgi:hypothetical protein